MSRYLKIILAAALFTGLNAAMSFAVSFTDSDVTPTQSGNNWTWTHILDNNEFTPALVAGDTVTVLDALLTIQMDITRSGTGSFKLFEVNSYGDSILLATTETEGSAGTVNNFPWSIDLGSLGNAEAVLQSLNDRSFAVTLSLVADHGTIKNIDSSILSGEAIVTAGPGVTPSSAPPPSVPEPGTLPMLGAGLIVVALVGNKCINGEI